MDTRDSQGASEGVTRRRIAAVLVAVLATTAAATGQNLVPNPSFENFTTCPSGYAQLLYAWPWYSPTTGSTDLFNVCCTTSAAAVPANDFGTETPAQGSGYAGFYAAFFYGPVYREYLEVPLIQPLQQGVTYQVSFKISLADLSCRALTSPIGCYFSVGSVGLLGIGNLPYTPQVASAPGTLLNTTNGWMTISGSFVASGGEDHMTIGNFLNDANTTTVNMCPGAPLALDAYYYIDDVHVVGVGVPPPTICFGNDVTPPNAIFEIEQCGQDLNGGCNSGTTGWVEAIACPSTIMGTYWSTGTTRDTDWYRVQLTAPGRLSVLADADVPINLFIFDDACPPTAIAIGAGDCPTLAVTPCLEPGHYRVALAPAFVAAPFTCAEPVLNTYKLQVDCLACPVQCCSPDGTVVDRECARIVCAIDPQCCDLGCDALCIQLAQEMCGCRSCVPAPPDLVSWWMLDDSGSQATDAVGANHGVASGGFIAGVPGMVDGCMQFGGTNGVVAVPDDPSLDVGCDAFTIDAWVRLENPLDPDGVIVEKWGVPGWSLSCLPSGALRLDLSTASVSWTVDTGSLTLPANQWVHVAATSSAYTASNGRTIRLYVNGALAATSTFVNTDCLSNARPLTIGNGKGFSSVARPWRGEIDEVEFFSSELPASKVNAIYLAREAGKCKQQCVVASTVAACITATSVVVPFSLCNATSSWQSYAVTIAPNPPGACTGPALTGVPLDFANPVAIGPGCTNLSFTVTTPSSLAPGQSSCLLLVVTNTQTGITTTCPFQIRRDTSWCPVGATGCCPPQLAPAGSTVPIAVTMLNTGGQASSLAVTYRVAPAEGFDGTPPFMLDGLPPGEPLSLLLKAEPGQADTAVVQVTFLHNDPTQAFELQLLGDEDGDGGRETLAAVPLIAAAAAVPFCPADLNGDGSVDGADLGLLLAAWGTDGPGDFNGDGIVDGLDLGMALAEWGACSG